MKFYTIKEIAIMVKLNEKTVWREIKAGRLKAQQIVGQWRVEETDLLNWINQSAGAGTPVADINKIGADQSVGPPINNTADLQKMTAAQESSANVSTGALAEANSEESIDIETSRNAELFVKHWNKYSPVKYKFKNGHLDDPTKRIAERFMRQVDNDLKSNLLTLRIFFLLHEKRLLRGSPAIILQDYIKRGYYLAFACPELNAAQEKELDEAMDIKEVSCRKCDNISRIEKVTQNMKCPGCKQSGWTEFIYRAIRDYDMEAYPVLKLFNDIYNVYLVRSQKRILNQLWNDSRSFMMTKKRSKIGPQGFADDLPPETRDWSIICDIYDIRNEIFDPKYDPEKD